MTLFDRLMSQTRDDAGCAVWLRSCCNGHPAWRIDGKTRLVRRALWEAVFGPIPAGHVIAMTCETPKCVSLEHMEVLSPKAMAVKLGRLGLMSGPARSAAIARTKRQGAQAKLTDEGVQEIRSSNESGVVLARKLGISQPHLSKIRLGKARRDFSNPWAQLLR